MLRTAELTISRLAERCKPNSPLCRRSPRGAALVARMCGWLLFALAALKRQLQSPDNEPVQNNGDSAT
jgi:hypothetical protein